MGRFPGRHRKCRSQLVERFVIDLESQANAGSEVVPVCRDETLAASGADNDRTSNEWG